MNKQKQYEIENRLNDRGYYRLVERYQNLDNNFNLYVTIIVTVISIPVVIYTIYYYPRTFKYLISHPISEILELLCPAIYIGACAGIIMSVIFSIIQYIVIFKTRKIHKQTYQEYGFEPPECEI